MREIKFRAWHKALNKMFSAEEMAHDQLTLLTTGKFINVSGIDAGLSIINEHMVPLQYTGLKDKNGQEIYEGDVIQENQANFIYCVVWEAPRFRLSDNKFTYNFYDFVAELEVIGNIYESPELLEGQV